MTTIRQRQVSIIPTHGRICYVALLLSLLLVSCAGSSNRDRAEKLYQEGLVFANRAEQSTQSNTNFLEDKSMRREYAELHDKAIERYKEALRTDPSYAEPAAAAARSYEATARFEEAIRACKKAISLAPKEAEYYRQIGYYFCQNMEPDRGKAALRQALKLNTSQEFRRETAVKLPDIALMLYVQSSMRRADRELALSLQKQAISILEFGHELDPDNADITEKIHLFTESPDGSATVK